MWVHIWIRLASFKLSIIFTKLLRNPPSLNSASEFFMISLCFRFRSNDHSSRWRWAHFHENKPDGFSGLSMHRLQRYVEDSHIKWSSSVWRNFIILNEIGRLPVVSLTRFRLRTFGCSIGYSFHKSFNQMLLNVEWSNWKTRNVSNFRERSCFLNMQYQLTKLKYDFSYILIGIPPSVSKRIILEVECKLNFNLTCSNQKKIN